jgi:hypothetical protein
MTSYDYREPTPLSIIAQDSSPAATLPPDQTGNRGRHAAPKALKRLREIKDMAQEAPRII